MVNFLRWPVHTLKVRSYVGMHNRVVEIIASEDYAGLPSQFALPAALYACRESRQAVEALYPSCFGSFLQPENERFNFDLGIFYLYISPEEEGLRRLFGVLKEGRS